MELKVSQSSLPIASSLFPKHFALFAQRWKLHIQRISWKGQLISKKLLVHVVKEGETLTSISKLYGVPILEIAAANKAIADLGLVLKGQHLSIPSAVAQYAQSWHFKGNNLHEHRLLNATPSLGFQWNHIFTVPSPHRLQLAKTTGSFLVLVPLIAFCIRCIMGAFWNVVARNLRVEAANKSGVNHHKSNSMRWKSVLSELRDPDALDAESEPDASTLSEDKAQLHFKDTIQAYNKLDGDYQKFLSECGMSNWGYWRGGSPK